MIKLGWFRYTHLLRGIGNENAFDEFSSLWQRRPFAFLAQLCPVYKEGP